MPKAVPSCRASPEMPEAIPARRRSTVPTARVEIGGFMIPLASRIRKESGVPTVVGWMITDPRQAEDAVRDQHTDLVMLAREMLRDPYWPTRAARELRQENPAPVQYVRAW